jgi:branched-chain amino acid transport system ATP-binding protein
MTVLLETEQLTSGYGPIAVLHGINLSVGPGEVVALLGLNGSGKSTLAKTIAGVLRAMNGRVRFEGEDITSMTVEQRVRRGIVLVPEGRELFASLTVKENLELGAITRRGQSAAVARDWERVLELFPVLKDFMKIRAGNLSGGQQQMLTMGRALMSHPRVLILDEPCHGLAPLFVEKIASVIKALKSESLGIVLVEEQTRQALSLADRLYVLDRGQVVYEHATEGVSENALEEIYLGRAL